MSSVVPTKFKGFAPKTQEAWEHPKLVEYDPKPFLPTDITIKIKACGVCGSDCHTLSGSWGPYQRPDLSVGHEIVGEVIEVGDKVTEHKLGDIVAVGAQSDSCLQCSRCESHNEQYCQKQLVPTYNGKSVQSNGYITQGGYASHVRLNQHFAVKVPHNLAYEYAAPLLCAGLTVYSPIIRNLGHDLTGKVVGIVGIGGLGAMGLQISRALGAKKVYAFSRSDKKKQDAIKLGADELIATKDGEWVGEHLDEFDLILNCASSGKDANIGPFLQVLKLDGKFVTVSSPPLTESLSIMPYLLLMNQSTIRGSGVGSIKEAKELLQLYADKGLKPWIEKVPISEEGVHQVVTRCHKSDVRYRFVLTDYDKFFS
ncbi:alcohol dehydrogenase, class V [Scheffersomyces coipomensis]|uniref:alcohol dehydrogenase, class V n=1 Tax=Scheffersomyces coipomensis TaxID=1788519 RepID=UPI00315D33D1